MELFVALAAIKLPSLCPNVDGENEQRAAVGNHYDTEGWGQVLRWRWGGGGDGIETPRP